MLIKFLLAACLMGVSLGSKPDMYGLLTIIYLKVNPDLKGDISVSDMASIYSALDYDNDRNVNKSEYVRGWMGISEMSEEMATGYFEISDRNHDGVVTEEDGDDVFTAFDVDKNGFVSDSEFVAQYTRTYHIVPLLVLKNRVEAKDGTTGLDKGQFERLFESLGPDGAGAMSKTALADAWVKNGLGTKDDSEVTMKHFDTNGDEFITKSEMSAIFDKLDKDGDDKVSMDELKAVIPATNPDDVDLGNTDEPNEPEDPVVG